MKKHISLILLTFFSIAVLKAQEKSKDTLFFKLDNKYVYESKFVSKEYLLKDRNKDEVFFFKGNETLKNVKPKEILCLKKFIRSSQFYDKTKKQKLNNYKLIIFFRDYVVFLVIKTKNETKYIHVNPAVVIND
ncbi:hypothetical protein [Flavobacterium sp. WC2430]|uniref:hypothetical protein n=1 Tax=Flavobacterium sp. WC2430 TaxID=3234137 RepID=UPI0034668F9B